MIDSHEAIQYLGASMSVQGKPEFDKLAAKIGTECSKIENYNYLRIYQKLTMLDTTTNPKLVYPSQIYWNGTGDGAERSLLECTQFRAICDAIWRTQISIVGLYSQTPINYLRGDARRRCLGLREPKWTVACNSAVTANTLRTSNDERVQALIKADVIDLDSAIECQMQLATVALAESSTNTDFLATIVKDDKLMKTQRLTMRLREAAADSWRESSSGFNAGITLSDQALAANDWRAMYRRLTDGALRYAFKLNGDQHSLRSKPFLAGTRAAAGNSCRMCGGSPETLGHVLGGCLAVNKLVTSRHDLVQRHVADAISNAVAGDAGGSRWTVVQNRVFPSSFAHNKPDMLACSSDGRTCYILDPTVRFEVNDAAVATQKMDKVVKYTPLIEYLKEEGFVNVRVEALYFGARGILLKSTLDFLTTTFGVDIERLLPLSAIIMGFTCSIYHKVISGHFDKKS